MVPENVESESEIFLVSRWNVLRQHQHLFNVLSLKLSKLSVILARVGNGIFVITTILARSPEGEATPKKSVLLMSRKN